MNPQKTPKKGRVTLSVSPDVLRAARALLTADDAGDLSPLVEKLIRDYLKKEGVPTDLSSEALKQALKQVADDDAKRKRPSEPPKRNNEPARR